MVWPRFMVFWFSKDNPTGHSERTKKMRQAERRGGKTISKSGLVWTLPAQLGRLKTGQDGKGLLRIHLWRPDDLPRSWDRIELFFFRRQTCIEQYQEFTMFRWP